MSGMSHVKYMLLGGAGVLAVALLAGVPLQSALSLAVFLACPLMMVFMMGGGHGGHGTEHGSRRGSDQRDSSATHDHDG